MDKKNGIFRTKLQYEEDELFKPPTLTRKLLGLVTTTTKSIFRDSRKWLTNQNISSDNLKLDTRIKYTISKMPQSYTRRSFKSQSTFEIIKRDKNNPGNKSKRTHRVTKKKRNFFPAALGCLLAFEGIRPHRSAACRIISKTNMHPIHSGINRGRDLLSTNQNIEEKRSKNKHKSTSLGKEFQFYTGVALLLL